MKKLFIHPWIGIFTVILLFIIETIFLFINGFIDGFPTFQNIENGFPIIIFQIVILFLIILSWVIDYRKYKNLFWSTIWGICGVIVGFLIVGMDWKIFIFLGLLIPISLYLYFSLSKPKTIKYQENGIPSDDSRYIPSEVKKTVWERDGGRCVKCGSTRKLEYDHNIPFSKGGSNTEKNIQILCKECNLKKSGKIE